MRTNRLRGARAVLAGAIALGALAWAPPPADGQRSIRIEEFHSDVAVQLDGSLLVTETLRPRFTGQWNGVSRVLDRQHTTAAGRAAQLDIHVLDATDAAGRPLRHEANRRRDRRVEVRVWVPNARDRVATVVLRYRVDGAIRYFAPDSAGGGPAEPYDELYWQATGTDWEVPIQRASARIAVPPGARPLQEAAYVGRPESGARAPIRRDGSRVEVTEVGPLSPGEGLTLAVAWPAGVVPGPPPGERSQAVPVGRSPPSAPPPLPAFVPILLPFLAFWLAFRTWSRRGRDPKPRTVTVHWEPPEGLSPAEVGTLIDHTPHVHDIVSTVVDLAVRGYLRIEERAKTGFLAFGKDYRFHSLRPRIEWSELAAHESAFLRGLFAHSRKEAPAGLGDVPLIGGMLEALAGHDEPPPFDALETVSLKDLENKFYKKLPGIRNAILDGLVAKGHYRRRPDRVRTAWFGMAAAAFFGGLFVLFGSGAASLGSGTAGALLFTFGAGLIGSGVVLAGFALVMPARTAAGARAREAALGFRRFLERVEKPRYRRMITSPEQFEAYLPFAMAFRCEEKWAKAFEGILSEPPRWYVGSQPGFDASSFARSMNGLAKATSSSMSSSPSSSGSGGGGSVGGGSGGGGGGGF